MNIDLNLPKGTGEFLYYAFVTADDEVKWSKVEIVRETPKYYHTLESVWKFGTRVPKSAEGHVYSRDPKKMLVMLRDELREREVKARTMYENLLNVRSEVDYIIESGEVPD